jgi:biotin carboxylase
MISIVSETPSQRPRDRALLFISGGVESLPAIARARELGLIVVVSDLKPDAPGCLAADHVVVASTYDVDATVAAARDFDRDVQPIDGVICVAADVPLTTACVALALGLPGIPVESARLAGDKLLMKERFAADGVPIPDFRQVNDAAELEQAAAEWGYPVVVKPVDSRGARGVLKLDAPDNLDTTFSEAFAESPTGRVMVERFLDGPQVSTESIVVDGMAHTPGFADRNYELLERFAPHVIENGADLPSVLGPDEQEAVRQVVAEAARSMGIDNGVVKGDIVVSGGEAYVIELAARLSGGYLCTHMIPLSAGVDFVGLAIRQALGETLDARELAPTKAAGVAQRWLFPPPGVVTRVDGVDAVAARPEVAFCEIRVKPGDIVAPMTSHVSRAGMVLAAAETRTEAVAAAERGVRDIAVDVEAA